MKRLLFAACAATSLFACSSRHASRTTAMNTSGSETTTSSHAAFMVPSNIQTSFSTQYPDATSVTWAPYDVAVAPIDWDLTDWAVLSPKDYTATYTMNGNRYYTWYDANGNWIGTTYDITDYHNGLPAVVNETIANKYGGYTIDKASQVTWKDRTAYELKLKNGNDKMKVLIDNNGNVLKQKDK